MEILISYILRRAQTCFLNIHEQIFDLLLEWGAPYCLERGKIGQRVNNNMLNILKDSFSRLCCNLGVIRSQIILKKHPTPPMTRGSLRRVQEWAEKCGVDS